MKDLVDEHGVSFKQAIFSGCMNVDSGIGVYAGSHDSYRKFKTLFDKIVQKYHGHGPTAVQPEIPVQAETVDIPDFPADEQAMILSTRIRVGRNLANFPLGPGLSDE